MHILGKAYKAHRCMCSVFGFGWAWPGVPRSASFLSRWVDKGPLGARSQILIFLFHEVWIVLIGHTVMRAETERSATGAEAQLASSPVPRLCTHSTHAEIPFPTSPLFLCLLEKDSVRPPQPSCSRAPKSPQEPRRAELHSITRNLFI